MPFEVINIVIVIQNSCDVINVFLSFVQGSESLFFWLITVEWSQLSDTQLWREKTSAKKFRQFVGSWFQTWQRSAIKKGKCLSSQVNYSLRVIVTIGRFDGVIAGEALKSLNLFLAWWNRALLLRLLRNLSLASSSHVAASLECYIPSKF